MPARAPAAATALARLPVEGQAKTLLPSSRAALRAQATTRSLKELVGLVESSLTQSLVSPSSAARLRASQQPGEAGLGVGRLLDVRGHRQQRLVAPHVARAGLDLLAGDRREVVGDLERTEALRTGVVRAEGDLVAALAARQRGGVPEGALAQGVGGGLRLGLQLGLGQRGAQEKPPPHLPRGGSRPGPELAPSPRRRWTRVPWRLPGRQRAVPSVPLDELATTVRGASHHASAVPDGGWRR